MGGNAFVVLRLPGCIRPAAECRHSLRVDSWVRGAEVPATSPFWGSGLVRVAGLENSPMMRPVPTQERRVHGSAGSSGHCVRQGRIGGPVPATPPPGSPPRAVPPASAPTRPGWVARGGGRRAALARHARASRGAGLVLDQGEYIYTLEALRGDATPCRLPSPWYWCSLGRHMLRCCVPMPCHPTPRRDPMRSIALNGDGSVASRQFETPPSITGRIGAVVFASYGSTATPGPSSMALSSWLRT